MHIIMEHYRKVAQQTIWVYFLTSLITPLTFFVRMLFAEKLDVIDYGLFYGLFAMFGFLNLISNFGLNDSAGYFVQKYIVRKNVSKVKTIFFITACFQIATSLIIILLLLMFKSLIITRFFRNEGHIAFMFGIFILYWFVQNLFVIVKKFFNFFYEQKYARLMDLMFFTFVLVVSFYGFMKFPTFKVPVFVYFLGSLLIMIVFFLVLVLRHKKYFTEPLTFKLELPKELFTYARSIFIGSLSVVVLSEIDILILQFFIGAESVAYYSTGFAIANLLLIIVAPLHAIMAPTLKKLWHEKAKNELMKIISLFFSNLLIVVMPLSLFVFSFSTQLIQVIFGIEFMQSNIIVKIFSISLVFKIINSFLFVILWSLGRPKQTSRIMIIGAIINLGLDIIFVNVYQNIGVAVATSISYVIMTFLATKEIGRVLKINVDIMDNVKVLISSGVFLIIIQLLKATSFFTIDNPVLHFLINGTIIFLMSFLIYSSLLIIFGVITRKKVDLVKNLFFSKI